MSKTTWLVFFFSNALYCTSWDYRDNPILQVSKTLNINLESLPRSGEVTKFMGANWIWPIKEGFISNRWALQNPKKNSQRYDFKFLKHSGLESIDIGQLSPSEKFDLISGNTNWKFTRSLKNYIKKIKNPGFHAQIAFAETSLNYLDQRPVTVKHGPQIINLGSSDLKALITANYFLNYARTTKLLGELCLKNFTKIKTEKSEDINAIINTSKCHGLNPGAFHVMISNFLGIKDQGISIDLERDKRLKIRPIIGFISKYEKISGNNELIEVTTYLKYLEPSRPSWINKVAGSRGYAILKYHLELDKKGNITGGQWISAARPDFLIIPRNIQLKGQFSRIQEHTREGPNYKIKSLTQKLIIKDFLNRISKKENISDETLNKVLTEYANTSKEYYRQKKASKKELRKVNTRELDTERDILLKRLSKHKIQGKLKRIHDGVIDTANMTSGNIFKKFLLIRSSHKQFIEKARSNNEGNNLKTLGEIAFIQKKLINNYFKKSIDKKVNINSLYLNYLMEETIYKRRDILTKSENFLLNSKSFLEGLQSESNFFKLNRKGRVFPERGRLLGAKIKELEKGESSSFKKLSKKLILKKKVSRNKGWKDFLKPSASRSIASVTEVNPKTELTTYLSAPLDQKKLKNIYTTTLLKISIATKKETRGRKVTSQSVLNKELKDDIQNDIQFLKKNYDFDIYLLNAYREVLNQKERKLFKDPKLEEIKSSLFTEYQTILTKDNNINQQFIDSIKEGKVKQFEKLQKLGPSLSYKNVEGENAIMTAVKHGQMEMLGKLILSGRGLINLKNSNGQNALFLAVINENKIEEGIRLEIIESLLKAGIKKNLKDNYGKSPKDYISDSGLVEAKLGHLLR